MIVFIIVSFIALLLVVICIAIRIKDPEGVCLPSSTSDKITETFIKIHKEIVKDKAEERRMLYKKYQPMKFTKHH